MLNKNDGNGVRPLEDKALSGGSGGIKGDVQKTARIAKEQCNPGGCAAYGNTGTPPCMEMCPTGAIEYVSDYAVVDSDFCINCNICYGACPYDAISIVW